MGFAIGAYVYLRNIQINEFLHCTMNTIWANNDMLKVHLQRRVELVQTHDILMVCFP